MYIHTSTHLGEESPPLPVTQLQVGSAVPLENLQSTELLLLLSKGPDALQRERKRRRTEWDTSKIDFVIKYVEMTVSVGSWETAAVEKPLLACQIPPTDGLEVNDDVSDLQVPLFFQVGQDSSPEEDLTLADTEKVSVQLQGLNLPKTGRDIDGGKGEGYWRYLKEKLLLKSLFTLLAQIKNILIMLCNYLNIKMWNSINKKRPLLQKWELWALRQQLR